jgi:hypothetical protein
MANLTVTIDERVLLRARIRALEQGTSVNAVVSRYLERYAGVSENRAALQRFVALASAAEASSGPRGRSWRRDDLYERGTSAGQAEPEPGP